jgi:hypothetical protein
MFLAITDVVVLVQAVRAKRELLFAANFDFTWLNFELNLVKRSGVDWCFL